MKPRRRPTPPSTKSPAKQGTEKDEKLINNLTVGDAEDLLRKEGGTLTYASIAFRGTVIVVIAVSVARAIARGNATAAHLILPSIAEYMALLVTLPILAIIVPHEAIRKEVKGCLRLLFVAGLIAAGWVFCQAKNQQLPWSEAAHAEAATMWNWIVDHQMHWPMLGAILGGLLAMPGRVRLLKKYGPPFYAVSLGCGMRVVILLFGAFLLPLIAGSSSRITWTLWTLLLIAELGSIYMQWDIQKRLKKRGITV